MQEKGPVLEKEIGFLQPFAGNDKTKASDRKLHVEMI